MVVLKCYGDESSDETQARVFAMAGLFAPEDTWAAVEDRWVQRTGGKEFHANKCESEFGRGRDPRHKENLDLYFDLTQIIARSALPGYGIACDMGAYREVFPGVPPDSGYYLCFQRLVTGIIHEVERLSKLVRSPEPVRVDFMFDSRLESNFNAGMLYHNIANSGDWFQNHGLLGSVAFEVSSNPRVQMADLVAREAMKALDNMVGPKKRELRGSSKALLETWKISFELIGREYWEDQKAKLTPETMNPIGMSPEVYLQWLQDKGLKADTVSNRQRFFAEWLKKRGSSS